MISICTVFLCVLSALLWKMTLHLNFSCEMCHVSPPSQNLKQTNSIQFAPSTWSFMTLYLFMCCTLQILFKTVLKGTVYPQIKNVWVFFFFCLLFFEGCTMKQVQQSQALFAWAVLTNPKASLNFIYDKYK